MELFVFKLLDCILGTFRSIFTYKNKMLLSALFNALGTYFSLTMVVRLVKADSTSAVALICLAAFVGSYIPMLLHDRLEKEKVFVFHVTPDNTENGKSFADRVRQSNIPVFTFKGYNKYRDQVLCSKVFSQSKEESRLIKEMIPSAFKYHIIETKNYISS